MAAGEREEFHDLLKGLTGCYEQLTAQLAALRARNRDLEIKVNGLPVPTGALGAVSPGPVSAFAVLDETKRQTEEEQGEEERVIDLNPSAVAPFVMPASCPTATSRQVMRASPGRATGSAEAAREPAVAREDHERRPEASCHSSSASQPSMRDPLPMVQDPTGDALLLASANVQRTLTPSRVRSSMPSSRIQGLDRRWLAQQYHRMKSSSVRTEVGFFVKVERDWRFDMVSVAVIIANLIYLSVQMDSSVQAQVARLRGEPYSHQVWALGDAIFCGLFSLELAVRFAARGGRQFVFGGDKFWNMFDILVIFTSLTEVIAEALGSEKMASSISFIRMLRTLRVIRIFRVLRVARNFSLVRNIKTMLHALLGSISAFTSAICLFFVMMFVFCLIFLDGVQKFLDDQAEDSPVVETMHEHYGSFGQSLWTLLAAVTGGYDWVVVSAPMITLGPAYRVCFLVYMLCMMLGLLNILNGIFINAALQSSAMDRELALDAALEKHQALAKELVSMFFEADREEKGCLSWPEFQYFMQDESIKAYFMALNLDMSSSKRIFELLDKNGSGSVGLMDFVEGCIQLRGSAKMVDLCLMKREVAQANDKLENLLCVFSEKGVVLKGSC